VSLNGSAPKWILIADDDALVRELWAEALTKAGFRVLGANTGRETLDILGTTVPDLLLLDLHNPVLSGEDVLVRLRATAALQSLPVLIISGFLEDEQDAGRGLNIVGRLAKPQPVHALVAAVREAVERSRPIAPVIRLTR
jgi:two-component system KDP operon response regulator KdpE